MPDFLKDYGTTQGPLGFPMKDEEAKRLEIVIKGLPKTDLYDYRTMSVPQSVTEVSPGDRSDVSWISTESPDRGREVVSARGMDNSHYLKNPIVTLGHNYQAPSIGRSIWQKRVKDGPLIGIKAKTRYHAKPDDWPKDAEGKESPWPPDKVFALVKSNVLLAKSIGFLPTKAHSADDKDYAHYKWPPNSVDTVFDEWLLLEYAACTMGMNQDCLVEAVGKGSLGMDEEFATLLGLDWALFKAPPPAPIKTIVFTSLDQIEAAMMKSVMAIDFQALATERVQAVLDLARGRI